MFFVLILSSCTECGNTCILAVSHPAVTEATCPPLQDLLADGRDGGEEGAVDAEAEAVIAEQGRGQVGIGLLEKRVKLLLKVHNKTFIIN